MRAAIREAWSGLSTARQSFDRLATRLVAAAAELAAPRPDPDGATTSSFSFSEPDRPARSASSDSFGGTPGVTHGPAPAGDNRPPKYPEEARRRRQSGTVLIRVTIGADGRVVRRSLVRSSGVDLLDAAAIETVSGWRFTPARVAGAAVACEADVPVVFVLRP